MNETDKAELRDTVRNVLREEFKGLFLNAFEPFATSMQQGFLEIRQELVKINQRLDKLEERVARLEERVDKLETRTSQILRRLDNVDSALSDLRLASREGRTEVEILKERLTELETRVRILEESAKYG